MDKVYFLNSAFQKPITNILNRFSHVKTSSHIIGNKNKRQNLPHGGLSATFSLKVMCSKKISHQKPFKKTFSRIKVLPVFDIEFKGMRISLKGIAFN